MEKETEVEAKTHEERDRRGGGVNMITRLS